LFLLLLLFVLLVQLLLLLLLHASFHMLCTSVSSGFREEVHNLCWYKARSRCLLPLLRLLLLLVLIVVQQGTALASNMLVMLVLV